MNLLKPALAILLLGALSNADSASNTVLKTIKAEPGQILVLNMHSGGSAEITGWDKDEVRIELSDSRNDMNDWSIDLNDARDAVVLETWIGDDWSNSMETHIRVPHRFNIEFNSAGGGLNIRDVEGRFTGQTGGGEFIFTDCKGEVELQTGGGDMRVTDCQLDGFMSTGGGDVLVDNVVGNLKATSGGGEVRYKNVRNHSGGVLAGSHKNIGAEVNPETVSISNAGGDIEVGAAAGGAVLTTGGGDIVVHDADQFVNATTGGGDITLSLGRGWVVATTGAGDIQVALERVGGSKDIELTTGHGDVRLTVPKDAGLEFDIDVSYTRDSSRKYRIDSDLEMSVERTDAWENKHGSWKKHIYGTGKVNGGGQTVRIRTVNGNVYIRTP